MRQYLLTRAAYGAAWDEDSNRRRLAVTRAVTVPAMAAQTWKGWTWLVALDRDDPLASERRAAFQAAGVPVLFLELDIGSVPRDSAAAAAYRAPWNDLIGPRDDRIAMTRLDDDDALAPWAMGRIRSAAEAAKERTALVMPIGIRVYRGGFTPVRHQSNAMHTLVTLPGDELTVYDYRHRFVREVAPIRLLDKGRIAWLWSRHEDTISGWRMAHKPLSPSIRSLFPSVDWSIFGVHDGRKRQAIGVSFR